MYCVTNGFLQFIEHHYYKLPRSYYHLYENQFPFGVIAHWEPGPANWLLITSSLCKQRWTTIQAVYGWYVVSMSGHPAVVSFLDWDYCYKSVGPTFVIMLSCHQSHKMTKNSSPTRNLISITSHSTSSKHRVLKCRTMGLRPNLIKGKNTKDLLMLSLIYLTQLIR